MTLVAQIGSVVGCAGLALLLAAPRRDLRLAGLAAWALGLAALAAYLAPSMSAARLAAAAAAGLLVAAAGAWALLRWPYLLAFATLACLPARVPVTLGDEDANLLLPLYAVVGALALALGWQLAACRDDRARELGPVALPLAAFVAWTGLTLVWSVDVREGAIFVGAFVLPFGLLSLGIARLPWRGRRLTWLWVGLVGTALAYASVGLYQWATREVFWNQKVIVGNAYAPFFRVNSIFWDPSIYGRYLSAGILTALAGILLGGVRGTRLAGLYAVVAAMWVGLFFSFSQSSFAALSVGAVVAALVVWGRRAALALAVSALVLALGALAVPQARDRIGTKSRSGLDAITSDRSTLVGEGVRIALDRPLGGVGVGGFKRAYADRVGLPGKRPKKAASHTTPVTVAAEEGLPGLAAFAWVVAAALLAALRGLGRGFTSRVSFAVGLTLLAITVHSLFYNAMFEDPMTWALLGLVALSATVPRKGAAANGGGA
ncbi:O-antigen ligase-like membrane protein [Gaiella occulta]|uniref:O-antigen ligase-like membrane protein n=1 Tax=Gaiella occulta TaxID=1002870 RepID=A0A7M2YXM4_9ACTN|nr:O-antigen ligase family protein [Gaiella occulta]RDI74227.1 O-antigen ligase-like membrane protein [Gaiella occulta]